MRKSKVNRYEGCVEQWKINLALSRIKAFRFPKDQQQDVLQQLVMSIVEFRFCPEQSNGASESTALYRIITNRLTSIRRSEQREQSRVDRHRELLGVSAENAETHAAFVVKDQSDMQLDIQQSLAALSEQERAICQRLMAGDKVSVIARDLNMDWHAVERSIDQIRKHFSEMELDAWLQK